MLGNSLKLI